MGDAPCCVAAIVPQRGTVTPDLAALQHSLGCTGLGSWFD